MLLSLSRSHGTTLAIVTHDAALAREAYGVVPGDAAATAALFGPLKDELEGKRVGVVVCGANIDVETFAHQIARGNAQTGCQ